MAARIAPQVATMTEEVGDPVILDGETLTLDGVVAVARHGATVRIADEARDAVRHSRERVDDILASEETVYGVNTGFGELVTERIPAEEIEALQTNLLRSHASGAGRELSSEEVRAMLVARLNALVKGYSGVREAVIDHLLAFLNKGLHPVVKSRGSLGASGDLAPLAHASLVLIGEGQADVDGERLEGSVALQRISLEPLTLGAKDGLALINGTELTSGLGALAVHDATNAVRAADIAGALSTEVTMSSTVPSHPLIAEVRAFDGQSASARNIRRLTADSQVVESHRNCDRIQDAYSVRCLPQVHGAVRDAIDHLRAAIETELNSATDNPLVFDRANAPDRASGAGSGAVLSAGNFHGEPLALRLDYATNALTELAAISERRVDRLLNPNVQEDHLPSFLTDHSGSMSGLMIAQYTAAALLNDCRATGAHSTDSTPVSGNQADHVSMSAGAAFSFHEVVEAVQTVVAIELLCAAEAAEYVDRSTKRPDHDVPADGELDLGRGTDAAYETIRSKIPPVGPDRPLHGDIDQVRQLVYSGRLIDRVTDRIEIE
jgi:histidine ammonia-lyase